ncbi:TetR/AcrR family transcriptional regulator [Sphingopyxis sp. JAI128]|uniref:TetR/AcrR family transcriptional regulator n=1 Tax=Sphingopyxis sp. JAI128 TaxID=2723066 RepID=UPI001607C847|nr:TetR/AcrR family transcriptional regulator [Sphingopyxis sp. JAI128]MBB6427011.1 AcrR family transcriptional regulator [Sphingopyxis sp. JAI128]
MPGSEGDGEGLRTAPRAAASDGRQRKGGSKRERRRAELVAIASAEINEHGVRGLVLADVAERAGMTKANLTYYFRRKEDLAAACFDRAIDAYKAMIADASAAADPEARLAELFRLYFDQAARVQAGEESPLAILSDIRALEETEQERAVARYGEMLLAAAALLAPQPASEGEILRSVPRAQMILVQLFWSAAWSSQYAPDDYPQVARRLFAILARGLTPGEPGWNGDWARRAKEIAHGDSPDDRAEFFRTATREINRLGFRGASIDRIAAGMKLTKGAIYHHFDTKDALLEACFERSFAHMWRIIRAAEADGGSPQGQLVTVIVALVAFQTGDEGPFLRDTALTALRSERRAVVLGEWNRIILHLAAMVTEGIAAGEVRAVDALLAAQAISATVNAADEINRFLPENLARNIAELCARPLLFGVFSEKLPFA